MSRDESGPEIKLTCVCNQLCTRTSIINHQFLQMISTPYPAMEEDDDWLNDTGPNQGGATDPLTNVEYDRIASKYSDVCPLVPNRFFFILENEC
jgi:hypothetical protein